MSGSLPTTKYPANIVVRSITPTLISVSHNLIRQTRSRGGQQWAFDLTYPVLSRAEQAELYAFIVKQRGQYEDFLYTPNEIGTTRGTSTGATVNGGSQTGRTVNINSLSGTLKSGDFVKFANHTKVYMLVADVGAGGTALTIEPALSTSPADASAVTVVNVPFTVAMSTDMTEYQAFAPSLYNYKISLVESL